MPPVPVNTTAFLEWLQTDKRCFSLGADTPPLYERRKDRPGCFDWVPTRSTRPSGYAMVGGPKVARVIEEIRKLAQAPRPTALLLVGETGVGKGAQRLDMRHPGGPKGFIADVLERVGGNRTAPIGLLCRTGNRDAQMQRLLLDNGFTQVFNMREGMVGSSAGPGWIKRGLPVEPYARC